jgi:SAM-dependent methyltransferase
MQPTPQNQFTTVATVYDHLMQVVPYRHWVDYVEQLWQRFHAAPRTVLELACGTGNVLLELRERGYEVAGVDNSAEMLEEARRKAGPEVDLHCQDMRFLSLGRSFDACVCLFDSLNYLLDEEQLREAFAGARRHLNRGGLFIFDMNSIRALEAGMFNQEGRCADGSLHYVWRSRYDPWTRLCEIEMNFNLRTEEGLRTFIETHVQRGYSLDEITGSLEWAGLEVVATYDSFTYDPPTAHSDRYHVIARHQG